MTVEAYKAARTFLLANRDDYATAYRDFRWPDLPHFNWALDWFDAELALGESASRPALTIVGDGPERKALEEQGTKLLSEAITFTGQLSQEDNLRLVQSAAVYVQNSSYEGLSHQLIEALMLGKAIVATAVGGNPELIQDGVNGLLVPHGNTQALSDALQKLLEDKELRARLGAHAKESSANFQVPAMIQKTRTLLTSVIP